MTARPSLPARAPRGHETVRTVHQGTHACICGAGGPQDRSHSPLARPTCRLISKRQLPRHRLPAIHGSLRSSQRAAFNCHGAATRGMRTSDHAPRAHMPCHWGPLTVQRVILRGFIGAPLTKCAVCLDVRATHSMACPLLRLNADHVRGFVPIIIRNMYVALISAHSVAL